MQDLRKIVRSRLQAPPAESHPDADVLTAFAERSLADSERAPVLQHLSHCGDCREIVALALPAPELVDVNISIARSRDWFSWPILRWSLVAAGILAITSVGIMQLKLRQSTSGNLPSALTARNDTAMAGRDKAMAGKDLSASSAKPQPEATLARKQQNENKTAHEKLVRTAPASRVATTTATLARNPAPYAGSRSVVSGSSQLVTVQPEAAPPMQLSQNQPSDQLVQNRKQLPLQNRSFTNSEVVKAKDAAPEQTAPGSSAQALEHPDISSPQVAPSPMRASARWTISSAGTLQRSFDAGKTWEDVSLNPDSPAGASYAVKKDEKAVKKDEKAVTKDEKNQKIQQPAAQPNPAFLAVTAIDSEVWAGGSAATLFHSGDSGAHWRRVLPSSAGAVLTGDITAIEFPDQQHGRVRTSAGEVWDTADNGQTWSLQQ
jgi:hypothetical protein